MEYEIFLIMAPISIVLLLVAFLSVWRFRKERVGLTLLWYFFIVILYLAANMVELLSGAEWLMLVMAKVQHILLSFIGVTWVAFAMNYTGLPKNIRFSVYRFIFIIPVLSAIVLNTSAFETIFYTEIHFGEMSGFSTVDPEYGPLFWVLGTHLYLLMFGGAALIVRFLLSAGGIYRRQAFWVLPAIFFPALLNICYILPLPIFVHKDFMAIAFAASGIFFYLGIIWHKLLEIIPVGRKVLLDEMDTGILFLNKQRVLVDFNKAAARFFSLHYRDSGASVYDIDSLEPMYEELMKHQESQTDFTCTGSGGRRFSVRARPFSNSDSLTVGTLVMITDVTLQANLLEEVQRQNAELRNAQLQLIQKEKLASIGQISAGIAHELRNPVSFLQSNFRTLNKMLDMKAAQALDAFNQEEIDEVRVILDDSGEGFARILHVVDSLLHFARAHKESDKRDYDLHRGLEGTLKITSGLHKDHVRIEKEWGDIPVIRAFEGSMNQVFLNIVDNAVQAARTNPEKAPVVRIRTGVENGRLFCEILDNGALEDETLLENVFEPFFTTKENGQGTGLGLSLSRDIIVKQHDGTIEAFRRDGWTVFRIELPV